MSGNSSPVTQYVTFTVAGHYFGIATQEVQEVLREQRVTPVPLAPEAVEGLINLRGQIVPAVDMRQRLRLEPRDRAASPPSVVVRTQHGSVSLRVDDIGDVLEFDASACEPPPTNLEHDLVGLVRGVHKLEDRLLLVLDGGRAAGRGSSEARQRGAEAST